MSLQTKQYSSLSLLGDKGRYSRSSLSRTRVSSPGFSSFSCCGVGSRFSRNMYGTQGMWASFSQPSPRTCTVTVNKTLLDPLNLEVDPTFCAVRNQEKEQIKSLNNRFASFIDKVCFLEQQNKMLETKWHLLKEEPPNHSQVEKLYERYITRLRHQLDALTNDGSRLDSELKSVNKLVLESKEKFEDEVDKKTKMENDFVLLKKDFDIAVLMVGDHRERTDDLKDQVAFKKAVYEEEAAELRDSKEATSVTLYMDNSRDFNMEDIIADVKEQYECIATKSREEAEILYKTTVNDMSKNANYYDNELRITKRELEELRRLIKCQESEIAIVMGQLKNLEAEIEKAKANGISELEKARKSILDLEENLKEKKQEMASKLKEYQTQMNAKMALDIEIATYKALLEGEENRISHQCPINIHQGTHTYQRVEIQQQQQQQQEQQEQQQQQQQRFLIKKTETQDNRTFSYK